MVPPTISVVSLGGSSSRENCFWQEGLQVYGKRSLCCLNTNSQRDFVLILDQQDANLILALEMVSISYCHPLTSDAGFDFTVCSGWSTSQWKQLSPQHSTLLKLSAKLAVMCQSSEAKYWAKSIWRLNCLLALRKTQEREEMINCWADAICLFEQLNELNNRSMAWWYRLAQWHLTYQRT